MTNLFEAKDKMVDLIRVWKAENKGDGFVRNSCILSFDYTMKIAAEMQIEEIYAHPANAVYFLWQANTKLGAVNSAMIEEGLEPFTLQECGFLKHVLIDSVEEFSGQSLQTFFDEIDKQYGGDVH
jgi:hypothetical protein